MMSRSPSRCNLGCRPKLHRLIRAATCGTRDNTHASADPAAGTISEKERARRRSVKNRKSFDCFKSAAGIRFSAVAKPTPKSFHRGTFWLHLLGDKRWEILRLFESRSSPPPHRGGLHGSKSRKYFYFICNLLPSKGCAKS